MSIARTPVMNGCSTARRVIGSGAGLSSSELAGLVGSLPALAPLAEALVGSGASEAAVASAVEFVLEGLHLSRRLNKDAAESGSTYRARS